MRRVYTLMCLSAGLLLGVFLVGLQVSHDEHVRKVVERYLIRVLSEGLGCSLDARLDSFDVMTGRLEFSDLNAFDAMGEWKWSARHALVSFSRLELFFRHILKLCITLENVALYSQHEEKNIAISRHIKAWLRLPPGAVPTSIKSLSVRHASMVVEARDGQAPLKASFTFNGELHVTPQSVRIASAFADGHIAYAGTRYLEAVSGFCRVDIPRSGEPLHVDVHGAGDTSCLPHLRQRWFVAANGQPLRGNVLCYTHDNSLEAKLVWDASSARMTGKVPYAYAADFLGHPQPEAFSGECSYVLWSSPQALAKKQLRGTVTLSDGQYAHYSLPKGTSMLRVDAYGVRGECECSYGDIQIAGDWKWDIHEAKGQGSLVNTSVCSVPGLGTCEPHAAHAYVTIAAPGVATVSYDMQASTGQQAQRITGGVSANRAGGHITIEKDNGVLKVSCLAEPHLHLASIEYKEDQDEQARIACWPDGSFDGRLGYGVLKKCAKKIAGMEIANAANTRIDGTDGALIKGKQGDNGVVSFDLSFDKAQIRLPATYTIVQAAEISGEFNYKERFGILKNGRIALNKGEVRIPHATFFCDQHFSPSFLYLPLTLEDCFVHWKKDIVGHLSGFLTACIRAGAPSVIKGYIALDKTHIKSNVLSSKFEHELTKGLVTSNNKPYTNIELDIGIVSRSLVHVKTSFLSTDARFHLALKGSLGSPELFGSVQLAEGILRFPYQPLYITHGRIYFLPNQLHDPTLELTAKNRIKNYAVTMNVSGSLRQPHITFASSPTLTEGQIITLLLGGSEDGSLFLAMPVSLTHSVESLVFGPAESTSHLQRYLLNLFKPLKNVRIVPRFSDESGRGGLRGSIMIEVNDNLRATIQKNFDLSEDVRIEVEYGLADSMIVRGVKDERGDLGAELEKTWKFAR